MRVFTHTRTHAIHLLMTHYYISHTHSIVLSWAHFLIYSIILPILLLTNEKIRSETHTQIQALCFICIYRQNNTHILRCFSTFSSPASSFSALFLLFCWCSVMKKYKHRNHILDEKHGVCTNEAYRQQMLLFIHPLCIRWREYQQFFWSSYIPFQILLFFWVSSLMAQSFFNSPTILLQKNKKISLASIAAPRFSIRPRPPAQRTSSVNQLFFSLHHSPPPPSPSYFFEARESLRNRVMGHIVYSQYGIELSCVCFFIRAHRSHRHTPN